MIGVQLSEILGRYRSRLSETSENYFDATQALYFANEAQDVICAKAPYTSITSYATTTIPYTADYLLPEEIIHPTGGFIRRTSGQLIRLNFIEKDSMDGMKSWGVATRTPVSYLELYVEGHKRPRKLTNLTDWTDIPAYLVTAVVDYMEAMAKTSDEENQEHQLAMARFNDKVMDLKIARIQTQYDQHERTRANRRISQGFAWPYWCTYRQTEEGIAVELYGRV